MLQLDVSDQIGLSKRLTLLKMERQFKREDIYTLDAETTANFKDKVSSYFTASHKDYFSSKHYFSLFYTVV